MRARVAELKTKALTAAGDRRPAAADARRTSTSSPRRSVAKERGIVVEEVDARREGDYESLDHAHGRRPTSRSARSRGTVFHDGKPRICRSRASRSTPNSAPSMIYVTNEDKPGFIGRFASLLGEAGVNIATFALGRDARGRLGDRARRGRRRRAGSRARQGREDRRRQAGEGAEVLTNAWRRLNRRRDGVRPRLRYPRPRAEDRPRRRR